MTLMMVKILKMNEEINISKNPKICFDHMIKMIGVSVPSSRLNLINKELNEMNDIDSQTKDDNNNSNNNDEFEIVRKSKKPKKDANSQTKRKNANSTDANKKDSNEQIEQSSSCTQTQHTYDSHQNQRNVSNQKGGKMQGGNKRTKWT